MLSNDVLGWGADLLTLMTVVCRDMRHLRLLTLDFNAEFIGTHGCRRCAGASRTVSTCTSATHQSRPDTALADVPLIRP